MTTQLDKSRSCATQRTWDDPSDEPFNGVGAALLVVSSGVYFAAVWLLTGLAPLPWIASGLSWPRLRRAVRNAATAHDRAARS